MILSLKITVNNTLIATKVWGSRLEVYFEWHQQSPRIRDSTRFPFVVSPALPTRTQTNAKWSGWRSLYPNPAPHSTHYAENSVFQIRAALVLLHTITLCSSPSPPKILPWCVQALDLGPSFVNTHPIPVPFRHNNTILWSPSLSFLAKIKSMQRVIMQKEWWARALTESHFFCHEEPRVDQLKSLSIETR